MSQMRDDGVESNDFNFLVLSEGNDFIKPATGPAPGFWQGLGPLLLGNYCESERQQLAGIGCQKKVGGGGAGTKDAISIGRLPRTIRHCGCCSGRCRAERYLRILNFRIISDAAWIPGVSECDSWQKF